MNRKLVTMVVTVSVPGDKSAAWARREVWHKIHTGSGWETIGADQCDTPVRVRKVAPNAAEATKS